MLGRVTQIRLLLVFALMALLIVLTALLAYRDAQFYTDSDAQAAQSHAVRVQLQELLSTLHDAETGQRGYLLTGNNTYLEPYQAARLRLERQLAQLDTRVAGRPAQQQLLNILENQIDAKRKELQTSIRLFDTQGFAAAQALVRGNTGKQHMDRIRATIARMTALETTRLEQLRTSIIEHGRRVLAAWVGLAALLLALLVIAYVAVVREFARRDAAEDRIQVLNSALQRQLKELIGLNEELEAFSYSVSHDLRAPLRAIDGFSLALLEDYSNKLDEAGIRHLQRVRKASGRMAELIEDLLTLSRVSRKPLQLQSVDLSDIATEIREHLEHAEPSRQIRFAITPGISTIGDPGLLRIVLENLLNNAWKFTRRQTNGLIEFGTLQHEDGPVHFVRDNGAGFDMSYANKLFRPFQRLHAETDFEGTGVGLATVARVVQRHGGEIWAEGEAGKGATFYFTLQANASDPDAASPA